jgi:hypothetical protein
MRNSFLRKFIAFSAIAIFAFQSCKDDSNLAPPPPNTTDYSFTEEFDSASALISRGWKFINASDPLGGGVWQNGGNILPIFSAYSSNGSYAGFIGTDFTSTSAAAGTISNWLVSPSVYMQNGDRIIFYARAQAVPGYPYRNGVTATPKDTTDWGNNLQLCINKVNDGFNVGSGFECGDFGVGVNPNALVDINPFYYESHNLPGNYGLTATTILSRATPVTIAQAFPVKWTRFEGVVSGLSEPGYHRFAFRYVVDGGGSNGRATAVGIDKLTYKTVGK